MTAIAGFTCFDSVLLLADTEETTSFTTKSDCDKLYRFIFPLGTVITGGAGDAHLIECANQELHQTFAAGIPKEPNQRLDGELIRQALNAFAQAFFEKTTGEYSRFGMPSPPSLEMLIAVNCSKKQTFLYRWTHNRVLWIAPEKHACIGSGAVQLHPMLRDFQFVPTKETALFCGLRMMHHAKRIVQGVGGRTEAIALLHEGATLYYGIDNTKRVEDLVTNFEEFLAKFVFTAVSNISDEFPEIEANAIKSFGSVPEILKQYRDQYRKLMTEAREV